MPISGSLSTETASGAEGAVRHGWIFCGGMIRSGSTLQYQAASELIERQGLGHRTTYIAPSDHARVLVGLPDAGLSTFKTHELTGAVQDHCVRNTGVVVYVYRDIRDVLASYQRKEGVRLKNGRLANLVEVLLERDARWRSMPRVYVSRYEDVIEDLLSEVTRLATFLGVRCADHDLQDVASSLSYEAQERNIRSARPEDLVKTNTTNTYHRGTLLHCNHLQGGNIGRYKGELPPEQLRLIESIAGSWIRAQGYHDKCA